ncbi:MAG: nitronate monooxygenase [Desulfobacterales bacterium]
MARKFKTKITELLGIEHPILCGGMQWISRAEIVAAVGNAGGIGFITAESLETPEDLRAEIKDPQVNLGKTRPQRPAARRRCRHHDRLWFRRSHRQ